MAMHVSRSLSLFFLLFICTFIFFLKWEYYSKIPSWMPTQRANPGREIVTSVTTEEEEQLSTPSVPNVTTAKKPAETTQTPETPMPMLYKNSFKSYPQWDFEDVYKLKSSPRPTTCAWSIQDSNNTALRKAFLPSIHLFLHKDDINMSEWNRLSHFNGPFGFMESEYKDVMAAINLIPKPIEPFLLPKAGGDGCVRCAVVGTGGILYGSKMGAEIDAHDYVFRVNGAVTKGFEEDVGNRTSVYVHTSFSLVSSVYRHRNRGFSSAPQDEGIKHVLIPEGIRDYQWIESLLKAQKPPTGEFADFEPREHYSPKFNESHFYVLHPDFLRYIRNRFMKSEKLNTGVWPIVRPTNGAFTVFLALHTCDTVDAYGFITNDYLKYSNYYIETSKKTKIIFYINHDYLLEKDLWHMLHDNHILKLFQRH